MRTLFTDDNVAQSAQFDPHSVDALATISIYLTFLASGQVQCEEDGGHYRPNHHAGEARQIEAALADITASIVDLEGSDTLPNNSSYLPYVIRKIFPQLPSYSSQFTVSVPLTRIRDIAHRNDIPKDLKQEIKHTLQNKLHRCAGPEDLQTSARLLDKINQGGYSHAFTEQFRIFHAELCAFFNASSLDDRLRYLQSNHNTNAVASLASSLLDLKIEQQPALLQLETLTKLRHAISELHLMQSKADDGTQLPSEDAQKTRLADIDLENYAFLLLADVAKRVENSRAHFDWTFALTALAYSMNNMQLSGIRPKEAIAANAELVALAQLTVNASSCDKICMLRTKAAIDRCLRFAETFSSAISDVYNRRVVSIGQALGVEPHAISVFAEAEIRSNITFQASRIADACAHECRKALSLPPWDPLFAGKASGQLIRVEHLSDLKLSGTKSVIVVCRNAEGDEDIPGYVTGVVLGRSLPHLSHLGVRARQAKIVFVCSEEKEEFDRIWSEKISGNVTIVVNAREGLATFSALTEQVNLDSEEGKENENVEMDISFDTTLKEPIGIKEATKATASSKCAFAGQLSFLASNSDSLFEAANGVALPHGMFQAERLKKSKEYDVLIDEYGKAFALGSEEAGSAAKVVYRFVSTKFVLNDEMCEQIAEYFPTGTKVMVRSSANAEDLEEMSGAGLYDSIANVCVSDMEMLKKAVSLVWASLWTKRAASSRATYGIAHNKVSMAVLIQEMVLADLSFVAFSYDPVSKERSYLYVEVAVGMGETLASATSSGSPYRFKIDRNSLNVEVLALSSYSDALIPTKGKSGGLQGEVIDYTRQEMTRNCEFRTSLVERIAKVVLMLEQHFDGAQDVEGAVTVENGDAQVYVVQARPQLL